MIASLDPAAGIANVIDNAKPMSRPTDIYTLDGLAWLKHELDKKEAQWDNYSGNNPNKGAAERRTLRRQIDVVSNSLKLRGVIPLTDEERLKRTLDLQTPSRLKGCCTEFEGQWFKIKFTRKDEGGFWEWLWEPVTAEVANGPGSYIHPGRGNRAR